MAMTMAMREEEPPSAYKSYFCEHENMKMPDTEFSAELTVSYSSVKRIFGDYRKN